MNDIHSVGAPGEVDLARHILTVPLATAVARMPAAVRAGLATVLLQRSGGSATWRWDSGDGAGTVTLSALSAEWTGLQISDDTGSAAGTADALAIALYGVLERQWAPPAVGDARRPGVRTKVAVAVAAVLVPVLAITGMRMLAPPAPLEVASAVTQFRQSQATPVAGTSEDQGHRRAPARARRDAGSSQPDASAGGPGARPGGATTAAAGSGSTRGQRRAPEGDPQPARQQARASSSQSEQRRAPADTRQAAAAPEEGVYRYATNGYESIDRPSARHDYPRETATTIRHGGCGFTVHWQPLDNRWDEMAICRSAGGAFIDQMATHREFYGQANDTRYDCERGVYAWRPEPGATWAGTCSDGEATVQLRGRVLGREDVRVGNETIKALHFSVEGRISGGDADGTWMAERWIHPDTGLVLRLEGQTRATSESSVGPVQYTEKLSLRLLSTKPER